LLQVKQPGGEELLIPFTHAICKVWMWREEDYVGLPEGLEDLNK